MFIRLVLFAGGLAIGFRANLLFRSVGHDLTTLLTTLRAMLPLAVGGLAVLLVGWFFLLLRRTTPRRLLRIARRSIRGLKANWVGSLLSVLQILLGVFVVILLTSWGNGVQEKVSRELNGLGPDLLTVSPGNPAAPSRPPGSAVSASTLTPGDVKKLESLPIVDAASGSVSIAAPVDGKSIPLTGVDPAYEKMRSVDLAGGRFVERPGELVLDDPAAKDLFKGDPENALGKTLKISGKRYEVVGVLEAKEAAFGLPITSQTSSFVITHDALALSGVKNVEQILVQARDTGSVSKAEEEIKTTLKRAHGDTEDFSVETQKDLLSSFNRITNAVAFLVYGMSFFTLLLVGIGVTITMRNSVAQRAEEIGTRKAMGATYEDLLFQFLFEALFLLVIGGVIGVVLGYEVSRLLPEISPDIPTSVSLTSIVLAFGVSTSFGLLFAVLPAHRAASKDPGYVMRGYTPPSRSRLLISLGVLCAGIVTGLTASLASSTIGIFG